MIVTDELEIIDSGVVSKDHWNAVISGWPKHGFFSKNSLTSSIEAKSLFTTLKGNDVSADFLIVLAKVLPAPAGVVGWGKIKIFKDVFYIVDFIHWDGAVLRLKNCQRKFFETIAFARMLNQFENNPIPMKKSTM